MYNDIVVSMTFVTKWEDSSIVASGVTLTYMLPVIK